METIEVKWAIHEDVVAMEHSLKVIASPSEEVPA